MARVMLAYPDGQASYSMFEVDAEGPHFIIGKQRYTIEDVINTGATAVVNNPELLRQLHELGLPARPTSKQYTITISVSADTRDRLKAASKATGRSVSNILEELAINWLDDQNQ